MKRNKNYKGKNLSNAKSLRANMTDRERKLWYCFLKDYPVRFYRQRPIDNYIVDFYCAKARLVVELDGSQHYSDEGIENDENRTRVLQEYSIKVIRFTNPQIDFKFETVCEEIDREVKERLL